MITQVKLLKYVRLENEQLGYFLRHYLKFLEHI